MEKTPRDFIFDNLLSMSAYWACTGAIIASLTAYYGFSLALSNVVTGLSGTLPILQLAGGLAYERTTRPLRFLRLCNGTWRVLLPLVFFSVLLGRHARITFEVFPKEGNIRRAVDGGVLCVGHRHLSICMSVSDGLAGEQCGGPCPGRLLLGA